MASVSYGLNRGTVDVGPDEITVGTLAVSTSDIELRWDNTKGLTRLNIIQALDAFTRRLNDGRFDDNLAV